MPKIIVLKQKGSWEKTQRFLRRCRRLDVRKVLEAYGQEGVDALAAATPKDTGKTAASWGYKIETRTDGVAIVWTNANIVEGVPIAVILQYGHGTRNGGYVEGIDYINPTMRPIFEKIAQRAFGEVRME